MNDPVGIQIEAIQLVLKELVKDNSKVYSTISARVNELEKSANSRNGGSVGELTQDEDYRFASALKKIIG